jgi:hypothetical protein
VFSTVIALYRSGLLVHQPRFLLVGNLVYVKEVDYTHLTNLVVMKGRYDAIKTINGYSC